MNMRNTLNYKYIIIKLGFYPYIADQIYNEQEPLYAV